MLFVWISLIFFDLSSAELGCRKETGGVVDWYILYKLPKDSRSKLPLEKAGEAYVYLDNQKGTWVWSSKSVEDPSSYMASTYKQIIEGRKTLGYLLYNDQLPNSQSSSHYGHTKGILATDGNSGFWLVHSVPRFPEKPENGSYDYPDSGKQNGQSLLCITFSFDQLATIVNLFRFTRPQIYSRNAIKALDKLQPEIKAFFTGNARYVTKPPWTIETQVKSKRGQAFTVFGKHPKWGKDLYDSLVAPSLTSSLYVQSWQIGRGTRLAPDCQDPYLVYNIDATKIKFNNSVSASFTSNMDHSKWAAALKDSDAWVCVGDINRMMSQYKRGGGAVCLKSRTAWKAYTSAIVDIEGCPVVKLL